MLQRKIAGVSIPAIGLGCMNVSHAYGLPPSEEDGAKLLNHAFDLGVRHFDSAALYGFGQNEILVGKALKHRRQQIHLASKCGMTGVDGQRVIDGRPETLAKTIDESLTRLQTDHVDLYYLHRWDRKVPIEDSIGAMSRMVEQGKVVALGLSEVSAGTLRKAHAVHPIAAVQTEYSLWTRNAEIAVLDACWELGVAFVAFSPLARGFLANPALDPAQFNTRDIRLNMPRFQSPAFENNQPLARSFFELAERAACSPAQLALAWLLAQGDHIIPIPGTTSLAHLEQNVEAMKLSIDPALVDRAGVLINQRTVNGPRYPAAIQSEIDTEEF
ncbi:MAG TPA: aldo/keto reductase [Xanthomonadales bacterium]|nr:aldo/keto reductase [Xanthomonadales bacterium]